MRLRGLTNQEACERFWQEKEGYSGNISSDGSRVDSYSWCIGVHLEDGRVLLNGDRSRYTTNSAHQVQLRQAAAGQPFSTIPFSVFPRFKVKMLGIHILADIQDTREWVCEGHGRRPEWSQGTTRCTCEDFHVLHRLGGALFTSREGDRCFLAAWDAQDQQNFFVTELVQVVQTVAQAYAVLKPPEVHEAEAQGIKVLRQGDVFFIPDEAQHFPGEMQVSGWPRIYGTSHAATRLVALSNLDTYVRGTVRHRPTSPRGMTLPPEHRMLKLPPGWHRAVLNTSTQRGLTTQRTMSYSLGGRVD